MNKFLMDLKDWKMPELVDELALYRLYPEVKVAESKDLISNATRVAEIERLRKDEGFILKPTKEEIENLAVFKDIEYKKDLMIILEEAEVKSALKEIEALKKAEVAPEAPKSSVEEGKNVAGAVVSDVPISTGEATPGNDVTAKIVDGDCDCGTEDGCNKCKLAPTPPVPPTTPPQPAVEDKTGEMMYMGRLVTLCADSLINGKTYKELTLSNGEVHTLTVEEFNSKVTTR